MMPAYWEQYQTYIREHERTFIAECLPLFEQPSVSHQTADVRHCAELLHDMLQHEGVHAAIMETGGNPCGLWRDRGRAGRRHGRAV